MSAVTARRLWPLLLIALAVLAVACRDEPPPPPGLGEQAVLTCTDECTMHGQCGRLVTNEQQAVLANEGGPAVRFHDRWFPIGTLVTISEVNERQLIAARDGVPLSGSAEPFPHNFFRVEDQAGKRAWVSSWCAIRPES